MTIFRLRELSVVADMLVLGLGLKANFVGLSLDTAGLVYTLNKNAICPGVQNSVTVHCRRDGFTTARCTGARESV